MEIVLVNKTKGKENKRHQFKFNYRTTASYTFHNANTHKKTASPYAECLASAKVRYGMGSY